MRPKIGYFGARLDRSGLANQGDNLIKLLRPAKILAIDSTDFNKGSVQDYGKYESFDCTIIRGFPTVRDCRKFMDSGVTHIFASETVYNPVLYTMARARGVKVFTQINPEFFEGWKDDYAPMPTKYLLPSKWYMDEMMDKYGTGQVVHLPPPLFQSDFKHARLENFERVGKRRFLHVIGKASDKDRNGTLSLLAALRYTHADFEVVIRSQYDVNELMQYADDPRVRFDVQNLEDPVDLYRDFDAMILPRRYGGLCLPCNEALMAGLPVIMTDISPNNELLDGGWLVRSLPTDTLQTRLLLNVYSADEIELAKMIEEFATMPHEDMLMQKTLAFQIGYENFGELRESFGRLLT